MARFDRDEHIFIDDVITVSKDDWTKQRKFTDEKEAKEYYDYLKREEVQESIAKNQATAVAQNAAIIANQKRLIELEEQSRIQSQGQFPNPHQVPYYDPEYLAWKRQKAEEKAQERAAAAKKRREREIKEENKLKQLAIKIDNGECSVESNIDEVRCVIKKQLYKFKNVSVIKEICDSIIDAHMFWIFYENYESYEKIIIESKALQYAEGIWLQEMIRHNIENKEMLSLIFKNANHDEILKILQDITTEPEILKFAGSINFADSQELWYQEAFWSENKMRLLSGEFLDESEYELAVRKYEQKKCEFTRFDFLKVVASQNPSNDALQRIANEIKLQHLHGKITQEQKNEVYKIILHSPNCKFQKSIVEELMPKISTRSELIEIKPYCKVDYYTFSNWCGKMERLGYMTKYERRREMNMSFPSKNSGCIWLLIIVLSPLIYLLL